MRSWFASFATLALAACGSATGELPIAPVSSALLGAESVSTADPSEEAALGGGSSPVFADPVSRPPRFGGSLSTDPVSGATDDTLTDASVSDGPFAAPDPAGATLVARHGHVRLRELAERLVTARFTDAYLAVDDAVLAMIEADGAPADDMTPTEGATKCPGDGLVDIRHRSLPMRDGRSTELLFDQCRIGGTTLSGFLRRTEAAEGRRQDSTETLELDYRGLVVDSAVERATLTGTTRRTVVRRASECDGEDVDVLLAHAFAEVELERDGSLERLVDARHEHLRERTRVAAPGGSGEGAPDCGERLRSSFDGRATVYADHFGRTRVTLARQGRIVRDARAEREPPASATLAIDVDDGSRLALVLISERAGTARLDLFADAVAVSLVTRYRFEP